MQLPDYSPFVLTEIKKRTEYPGNWGPKRIAEEDAKAGWYVGLRERGGNFHKEPFKTSREAFEYGSYLGLAYKAGRQEAVDKVQDTYHAFLEALGISSPPDHDY